MFIIDIIRLTDYFGRVKQFIVFIAIAVGIAVIWWATSGTLPKFFSRDPNIPIIIR
jgi:hypothetical protein